MVKKSKKRIVIKSKNKKRKIVNGRHPSNKPKNKKVSKLMKIAKLRRARESREKSKRLIPRVLKKLKLR